MDSYLKLVVGPYLLLLPTAEVFEVRDHAPLPGEEAFTVWREHILPAISLRRRLQLPEREGGILIVRGESGHAVEALVVDRVAGMVRLDEDQLQPIPRAAGAATAIFDKVWSAGDDGRQALRLRGYERRGTCDAPGLLQ